MSQYWLFRKRARTHMHSHTKRWPFKAIAAFLAAQRTIHNELLPQATWQMDFPVFLCGILWDTEILAVANVSTAETKEERETTEWLSTTLCGCLGPALNHTHTWPKRRMKRRNRRRSAQGSEGRLSAVTCVNVSLSIVECTDTNQ